MSSSTQRFEKRVEQWLWQKRDIHNMIIAHLKSDINFIAEKQLKNAAADY